MVYGILLESVQHFIKLRYGEKFWEEALEFCGQPRSLVLRSHNMYPDTLMTNLASIVARMSKEGLCQEDVMELFGHCFVGYYTNYGYDLLLLSSGRYYGDFLKCLDYVHQQIRLSYPRMISPHMYIEEEYETGAILHYNTHRTAFLPYLKGQLKRVASEFYQIEMKINSHSVGSNDFIITLLFDNVGYKTYLHNSLLNEATYKVLSDTSFCALTEIFVFGFAFNPDNIIFAAGRSIQRFLGRENVIGKTLESVIYLRRPKIPVDYKEVEISSDQIDDHGESTEGKKILYLRGKMQAFPELNCIMYLCFPVLEHFNELRKLGLYANDLALHDRSVEALFSGCELSARLQAKFDQVEEKGKKLEENMKLLNECKLKSDELLYSMLPKSVAENLKTNEDPLCTCQHFDEVSILFAEILHITERVSNSSPMETVMYINQIFTLFDVVIEKRDVYKVETVGQVYMIVSGIPDWYPHHIKELGLLAIELREEMKKLEKNANNLRIGMHVGPVVGGVVGIKVPRYCLFGDTVNTASRMQTCGQAGKIHISHACNSQLIQYGFVSERRGLTHIKGKGKMETFWLLGVLADKSCD